MILNTHTYRLIKNALTPVPGVPSSAQLGEAMAAAWEFPSFHALNEYLTRVDTNLSEIPERFDVHPDRMIKRLARLGVEPDACRSLALTMFLVQDGDFALELMGDFEELHRARAYRFDQTSAAWRDAVTKAAGVLAEHAPRKAWHLPLAAGLDWRHPLYANNLAGALQVIPFGEIPHLEDSRDLTGEEFDQTDRAAAAEGGHLPITLIENVLGMCQHLLPDGARHLVLGPTGVVVLYDLFEICLVEYSHLELHMYPALYPEDGPVMI